MALSSLWGAEQVNTPTNTTRASEHHKVTVANSFSPLFFEIDEWPHNDEQAPTASRKSARDSPTSVSNICNYIVDVPCACCVSSDLSFEMMFEMDTDEVIHPSAVERAHETLFIHHATVRTESLVLAETVF
jgi:succinate dehydrogenase/fumarate reductase-like Fe-S protein